jgi:Na+-translocating ferredoxin:NAD+ oxidoreductase RNF subunit RnfB
MPEESHSFKIDHTLCQGKMACMRVCPTQAIRVKKGKAELLSELCIDCGSCLTACPTGAISATTRPLKEVWDFKYKVAVPSPVLFSQFPPDVSPGNIIEGLKTLGFDAVWPFVIEVPLINRAIRDYVEKWKGRYPLISSSCPVVVRLIQVSYPEMVEQLVPILPPRELAGRHVKLRYSEKLGISKDEVAAVYVTSCQAKITLIADPAERVKSNLDGAISFSDVYNGVLATTYEKKEKDQKLLSENLLHGKEMLQWSLSRGQEDNLHDYRYMSLTGLSNIIRAFDDIEKGKLRNIDFLECYACWSGCTGGNLTIDNFYLSGRKLQRLIAELPERDPWVEAEVEKRYPNEDFFIIKPPLLPIPIKGNRGSLKERIKRRQQAETLLAALPGLNCGLCGAPNCKTLALDIASDEAQKTDCIFFSKDRLAMLTKIYLENK